MNGGASHRPLDLRSDTVTRPDETMRAAMAAAEVGDDILDGDPTVRALEEKAAEILGTEATLWVPSGTMGNLIALTVHMRPGDRFLAPALAHVVEFELGGWASFAGGVPHALPWSAGPGRVSPASVRASVPPSQPYDALRDRLLCLENTHNAAGGTVTEPGEHRAVTATAKEAGLLVHLDGARIWNAAVALDVPPAELTWGVDSVLACLSKGLCAPMGSVLGGSAEFVRAARRLRKMLGGAVRQGGVMAAAGLVALGRIELLRNDHRNAQVLASGLRELGWEAASPETNIVLASVSDAERRVSELHRMGVLATTISGAVRFVTHADLSEQDIQEVVGRISSMSP
ncbi:GntG family PLP-dependent aldolase [Micromonospora sp. B11E3]|uniref:threonine aldolase family protein n=1 Tax=Micromonospora sp. B11E3 TaxID=3153562 RepID=UPI00325EDEED